LREQSTFGRDDNTVANIARQMHVRHDGDVQHVFRISQTSQSTFDDDIQFVTDPRF
jgi:hypothetical protein